MPTGVAGLGAALTAYHAVLVLAVPRILHLPLNLAMAGSTVAWARRRGLSWRGLGLDREGVGPGLRWGLGIAAAAAAGLALLLVIPGGERFVRDRRLEGLGTAEILYRTLVRIPLGTALAEEIAFRGVVFGALRRDASPTAAIVGSSLLFGLWHIGPALSFLEGNRPELGIGGKVGGVALSVGATAAAGVLFALLRLRSKGVVGPTLAHWALNGLATLGAVYAARD